MIRINNILKGLALSVNLMCFSVNGFSQNTDSLYKSYSTGLIYRYGGSLMKGNERISFKELSREFSMSNLGLDQYKISKKKKTVGRILLAGSLVSGFSAIAFRNTNSSMAYGFLGLQFATLMGSISYTQSSYKHLDRAIWHRNKDFLFLHRSQ